MAERVVLHVGSMKSGTTYLQQTVLANSELLRARGLLMPGQVWRDQVSGVAEVLGRTRVARPPREGDWRRLVDEIDAWPGTGLISMEFLGPVGLPKIRRVVESFTSCPVHVVVTARDLNRQIPAMWQEALKNGRAIPFDEYVAAVRSSTGPGKAFWREQTVGAMCQRWGEVVGIEHVRLVTVPRPGAATDLLWQRFCEAVGFDGGGARSPETLNQSMGAASAEVLRLLNQRLTDLTYQAYAPAVKHRLSRKILTQRRDAEPPVGFDVPSWLPELSERMIQRLRGLRVPVTGDLEELRPVRVPGVDPLRVPAEERLSAAIAGLEGLVRTGLQERRKG